MLNASPKPMIVPTAQGTKGGVSSVSSTKNISKDFSKNTQAQSKPAHATASEQTKSTEQNKGAHVYPKTSINQNDKSLQEQNIEEKQSFSNVMSDVLQDKPSQPLISTRELPSLSSVLTLQTELKDILPTDLVSQYVESGGEVFEELESSITSNSNHQIDLSQPIESELAEIKSLLDTNLTDQEAGVAATLLGNVKNETIIEPTLVSEEEGEVASILNHKKSQRSQQLDQLLLKQKEALTQIKGDEKPINSPLSSAISKLSGPPQSGESIQKTEGFLEGTEEKVDSKLLSSTSLKDGAINNEAFLKQLQSQMQPKSMSTVSSVAQPQVMLNTDNVQSNAIAQTLTSNVDPAAVKSLQIDTPVGQGQWSKQFNDQVVWLGSQKIQAAAIKLTPTDLGPVEINLKISKDIASIQFNSHSPQVRELIEQALPKLKEQLAEQGLHLADADVSDNSQQQMMKNGHDNNSNESNYVKDDFFKELNGEGAEQEVQVSEVRQKAPQGLIDYFA